MIGTSIMKDLKLYFEIFWRIFSGITKNHTMLWFSCTVWKVSQSRVFSSPYFLAFGLNTVKHWIENPGFKNVHAALLSLISLLYDILMEMLSLSFIEVSKVFRKSFQIPIQVMNFNACVNPKIEIHKTTVYQTIGPSFAKSSVMDVSLQWSNYTPELFIFIENFSERFAIFGCFQKCKS